MWLVGSSSRQLVSRGRGQAVLLGVPIVRILAVGLKQGGRLKIGGQEVKL